MVINTVNPLVRNTDGSHIRSPNGVAASIHSQDFHNTRFSLPPFICEIPLVPSRSLDGRVSLNRDPVGISFEEVIRTSDSSRSGTPFIVEFSDDEDEDMDMKSFSENIHHLSKNAIGRFISKILGSSLEVEGKFFHLKKVLRLTAEKDPSWVSEFIAQIPNERLNTENNMSYQDVVIALLVRDLIEEDKKELIKAIHFQRFLTLDNLYYLFAFVVEKNNLPMFELLFLRFCELQLTDREKITIFARLLLITTEETPGIFQYLWNRMKEISESENEQKQQDVTFLSICLKTAIIGAVELGTFADCQRIFSLCEDSRALRQYAYNLAMEQNNIDLAAQLVSSAQNK